MTQYGIFLTGTKINFDMCHNYLMVGGCLNNDRFVINVDISAGTTILTDITFLF